MNELISVAAAAELIRNGVALSIAGTAGALRTLPAGPWIGGTIPYFMVSGGGVVVGDDRVFVTDLSKVGAEVRIACYGPDELARITAEAFDNGFSLTIIPAGGQAHGRFAREATDSADAFLKPTVGWISGIHLDDMGRAHALVFDGRNGREVEDGAVVAHIRLPDDKLASVEIGNIFEQDDGDVLRFDQVGFEATECTVNGERVNLAKYLEKRGATDGRLPLVGDYAGACINVSFQSIDVDKGQVAFYAPVFTGIDYAENAYACLAGADLLVIVTEWEQFRALDLEVLKSVMARPVIVDLRNIYRPEDVMKHGFHYSSVGRPAEKGY